MSFRTFLLPATAAATLLLVSACQVIPEAKPDPTRFFVLSDPGATAGRTTLSNDGATVGLLGIRLPVYLADSRAIAIASPAQEIEFRDFERWAEPLDDGIERVLQSALGRSAGIARILTVPFSSEVSRDVDVQINVIDCEGFRSGDSRSAHFSCEYSIMDPQGKLVAHGVYRATPSAWNGTPGDLARLLSSAIADAAAAIAAAVPTDA